MKYLPSQIIYLMQNRRTRRNIRTLLEFLFLLSLFIVAYSLLFHVIMNLEGRYYSIITGFYWTLTVMSTLGFGDITFESDIGKIFSIIVLLSGIVFLLIMLPFAFIQFFYAPWLEAQSKSRAPRQLPENFANHVIITGYDPITMPSSAASFGTGTTTSSSSRRCSRPSIWWTRACRSWWANWTTLTPISAPASTRRHWWWPSTTI